MKRGTQQFVRFWIPPLAGIVLYSVLANIVGYTEIELPDSPNEYWFNLPLLAIAFAYYVLPFRKWANSSFHHAINENIRKRLVSIANVDDAPDTLTWDRVKNVFYNQVDNDNSLTSRSEAIRFNGTLWTSAADVTVISILFFIFSIVLWSIEIDNAQIGMPVFGGIALLSLLVQAILTRKHMEMSNDQLDYIDQYRKNEVKTGIQGLQSD